MLNYCNNIPSKLYHYAKFDDYTKDALLNRYIYIASPKEENDTYEFEMKIKENEEYLSLDKIFEGKKARFYGTDIDKNSSIITGQYDLLQKMRDDVVKTNRKEAGMYCLTDSKDNALMWSRYAHNDLCLEFNTLELLDSIEYCQGGLFNKVSYVSERVIDLKDEIKNPWKSFFIKTIDKWSKENEYRYLNLNGIDVEKVHRKLRFSAKALTNIYYGSAMQENQLNELRTIIHNSHYDNVKIQSNG